MTAKAPQPNGPQLSGFATGHPLGRGGIGVVHAAYEDNLGRLVAVKSLREPGNPMATASLVREARIVSKLDHPGIVPIYQLTDNQGDPAVVMRLISGRAWSSNRTCDPMESFRIAIRVCSILEYAHSRRVLHLDIKPSNILVGDFSEVYLIDWGIALDLTESDHHDRCRGTSAFMAPEMLVPGEPLTPATDVYLVAGCLYRQLVGTAPHPESASHRRLRPHAPAVLDFPEHTSQRLANLLKRALAVDPAARFATMADFRLALQNHVQAQLATAVLADASAHLADQPSTPDLEQTLAHIEAVRELNADDSKVATLEANVVVQLVEHALAEHDLHRARRLTQRLPSSTAEPLIGRIGRLAEAHEVGRDQVGWSADTPSIAERVHARRRAIGLILGYFAAVGVLVLSWNPTPLPAPPSTLAGIALATLGTWCALLSATRGRLLATPGIRMAAHTVSYGLAAIALNRLAALYTGLDPTAILQQDLLAATVVVATRVQLDARFFAPAVTLLTLFLGSIVRPDLVRVFVNLAPFLACAPLWFMPARSRSTVRSH